MVASRISKSNGFWGGKRVVLLGGASLIGSHLAKALLDLPIASLKIVDDLSSGSIENLQYMGINIINDIELKEHDLRNFDLARRAVYHSDIVFHLAAQHGGRGYVAGHKVELYDNLAVDSTIFRACSKEGVEKVVFSSSACAYPIELQQDTEEHLLLSEGLIDYNRHLPADGAYGTEKLIGEAMLDAYVERGDFKGVSTRSFTVYGPLMKENHAIAALIAKFMIRQDPLEIWGDGTQIRNWTYVEDNVQGALLAAEKLDRGAVNVGVEEERTPLGAHSSIGHIMGWYPKVVQLLPDMPVGPLNRVADATKLKSLGWKPKYSFEAGLRKTIDWYLSTHTVEEVRRDFERKLTER
jgi:nucleoside-diphosphate-sugar epimerase